MGQQRGPWTSLFPPTILKRFTVSHGWWDCHCASCQEASCDSFISLMFSVYIPSWPQHVGICSCLALTRQVGKCCLISSTIGSTQENGQFASSHWFFSSSWGPERIISPECSCFVSLERMAWGRTLPKTVQGGMGPASWLLSRALSQPL